MRILSWEQHREARTVVAFGLVCDLCEEEAVEPGQGHVHLLQVAEGDGREAGEDVARRL